MDPRQFSLDEGVLHQHPHPVERVDDLHSNQDKYLALAKVLKPGDDDHKGVEPSHLDHGVVLQSSAHHQFVHVEFLKQVEDFLLLVTIAGGQLDLGRVQVNKNQV